MRKFFALSALFLIITGASVSGFAKRPEKPKVSLTYNVAETTAFVVVNKIYYPMLTYIPLHFDASFRLSEWFGIAGGLVYRYENYGDTGPLYSKSGVIREKYIWTNHHEIFLLAGPRFNPLNTGIEGFFMSVKGGLGTAISQSYFNMSVLLQPDIGYTFCFKNPGFTLSLGLGVLLNLPFYETVPFAVPWDEQFLGYSLLGIIVHQATPILNIGVGVNW